jgi:hypothetical protein
MRCRYQAERRTGTQAGNPDLGGIRRCDRPWAVHISLGWLPDRVFHV